MALPKLGSAFHIRQAERYNFSQLFLQSFLTGLATSFFSVTTSSYFIKKLDASRLPLAYILSGVVGYLVIHLYKKLMSRYGLITAIVITNLLYILICGSLLYARLHDSSSQSLTQYVAFAGFVFIMPFSSLFALTFATLSLRLFDLGQSKRLIALVGLGEVIASILAYLMVPLLTTLMGTTAFLLLITMSAVLIGMIPLAKLVKANGERLRHVHANQAATTKVNFSFLLKDRYFMLIGIFTFFSVTAIYLADYSYLISVKFLSVENNIETAILVSVIFTVIKLGELSFSLFSSRFMSEYGMKISLLLLPLLLVLSSMLGVVSGSLFRSITFFIVAFLLLNKWLERVVRKGITNPALKVLYQVTEPAERAKVQTLIDGSLSQVSTMAAGLILLGLSLVFKKTELYVYLFVLAGACFIVYAIWLFFTQKMYHQYKEKIQLFLKGTGAKAIDGSEDIVPENFEITNPPDNTSFSELREMLKSIALDERKNSRNYLYEMARTYHSKAFKSVNGIDDPQLARKLSAALYAQEHYPARIAAIQYVQYLSPEEKLRVLRENYETLDHTLQYFLLRNVNSSPVQCSAEDRFYFTGLCRRCVRDILWIESTVNDLTELDNEKLQTALLDLREQQVFKLLQLFRILYDPGAVAIVENIWRNRVNLPENQVFAIELLENILEKNVKKIIIPLLEDIPLSAKKEKLREVFYFHNMDMADRLKDIVMKDFNLVDPYIKELAVRAYVQLTGDKNLARVFKSHPYLRLSSLCQDDQAALEKAQSLLREMEMPENVYHHKTFDMLLRWVARAENTRQEHATALQVNIEHLGNRFMVDCYGLNLLLEVKQQHSFNR
ncbi:MFS transporter [Sediminibacterium ginsengisoli]|uniref:ATP/ADP translocase n=1 Tax=Sediminibacterium ginsengisoli TaxID=413434 RepID=A0A1T4PMI9_9BACT|nr:MFS transporter [Sediminibacterium ginsengisoli]SJZ92770.1 ATP/ADP translocase [Sediminibacterium ginsengisoli]